MTIWGGEIAMRLLKLLLVLCVMLATSACGSDPVSYRNVQYPNYGQAEFDRDSYQCDRENTHVVAGTMGRMVYSEPQTDTGMAARCMQARGWQAYYAAPIAASPPAPAPPPRNEALIAYNRGDYATALRLWRPLAEQGDARAQFSLGFMYQNGWGAPQDYSAALIWYRKAADQGYAFAQGNLGFMYEKGHGVPQDYAAAVSWYRKAAEQGNAGSQLNLGVMYQNGWGVPKDLGQAHYWYNLAAAQGNERAKQNLARLPAKYRGG